MADDFGPGGIYTNIPRLDSHGRAQLPMFTRWNPDPVGNEAANIAKLSPPMQAIIAKARADNPNLRFVLGSGARSAEDQDWAKSVGWSKVGSKDAGDAQVHMKGNAADLWALDDQGRVTFDPNSQKAIDLAMETAAKELGTPVNWGGNWKSFKDAPHFELQTSGAATVPAAPPQGTTTLTSNNSNDSIIDALSHNIASIESGGFKNPYEALNPRTHAIGKYQVMPANVADWTQMALGHSMTPDEFKANPQAQEAVFRDQMSRSLQLYGPKDAASIWFTGKPYNVAGGSVSDGITKNADYVARATAGIDDKGTTLTSVPTPPHTLTPPTAGAPYTPTAVAAANPAPTVPPAPSFGDAAAKGDVGGMLHAALTKPTTTDAKGNTVEGKSLVDKVAGAFGADKQPPEIPAMPAAMPAQDPDPGLAPAAQQLFSTVSAAAAKPLTWNARPYGSNAGFQGTTLNQTGYGGAYG